MSSKNARKVKIMPEIATNRFKYEFFITLKLSNHPLKIKRVSTNIIAAVETWKMLFNKRLF